MTDWFYVLASMAALKTFAFIESRKGNVLPSDRRFLQIEGWRWLDQGLISLVILLVSFCIQMAFQKVRILEVVLFWIGPAVYAMVLWRQWRFPDLCVVFLATAFVFSRISLFGLVPMLGYFAAFFVLYGVIYFLSLGWTGAMLLCQGKRNPQALVPLVFLTCSFLWLSIGFLPGILMKFQRFDTHALTSFFLQL